MLPIGSSDGRSDMSSHLFPITGLASDRPTGPLVLPGKDCGLESNIWEYFADMLGTILVEGTVDLTFLKESFSLLLSWLESMSV